MKFSKRFLSMLLVLCMVLSMIPTLGLTARAATGDTYTLVTNASQLNVGDTVIIVAKDSAVALSTTQNTNNRGQVDVTMSTDKMTVSYCEGLQELTLQSGTVSETFAFYTGSGYLYAASSSNNYLKAQTENNANGSWKISIDATTYAATIKSQGANTRNLLQYNATSKLFSCYNSAQKDVYIYKKTAASAQTYSLFYSAKGEVSEAGSYAAGTAVTLPTTAAAASGYTFVGWSASTIATPQDTAPTLLTGTYTMPAKDTILYAVYAIESESTGSADAYTLVTAKKSDWSGTYVIADKNTNYVLDYATSDTAGNATTLDSSLINLSGTVMTNVQAKYTVTIGKTGTYYYVKLNGATSNPYLQLTSDGNTVSRGTSYSDNSGKWTITWDDKNVVHLFSANYTSRELQKNNSNAYFRCYTGTQTDICLYGAVSFSGYTTSPFVAPTIGDITATLVTSEEQLVDGEEYLILSANSTSLYAAGLVANATKKNLTRVDTDYKVVPHVVSIDAEKAAQVYTFSLEGSADSWKFNATNGDGYLFKSNAISSGTTAKNSLRLSGYNYSDAIAGEPEATADQWTISIDAEHKAEIKNVLYPEYHIRMNDGSNIFSVYTTTQSPVYLYRVTDYSSTGDRTLTVNIRCGEGAVYVLDKDGNGIISTSSVNDPKRVNVSLGDEVTLVMQPSKDYRLVTAEKGSSRMTEKPANPKDTDYYWEWSSVYGAYIFKSTIVESASSTIDFYNVTFLPRRLDTGITAVQATTIESGEKYVITGITYGSTKRYDSSTYLLYGDDGLTGLDAYKNGIVGRKSAAIKLSDINVTLDNSGPNGAYKLTGLNESCLYEFDFIKTVNEIDYYTIRMCGATTNQYLAATGKDAANFRTVTESELSDNAYWAISVDAATGEAIIRNKALTDALTDGASYALRFNGISTNLQFRHYPYPKSTDTYTTTPILYQAAQTGYIVSYSKVGNGTVTAVNSTTGGGVVSGSVQNAGNDITFAFTPAAGYEVASVTINGENIQVSGNTYTYKSLDKPIELIVTFKEIPISNVVTVEYYLNGALSRESETKTLDKNYYIIDLTPTVTINGTEYHYSDLTFSKAVVCIDGGEEVEYTSVNDSIAVGKNATVKLYFLTTAVNLNKTAKETTTPDSSLTGLPNGGTTNNDIGAFSGSNNQDANGNVKQTFEVELKVQSSDMIPGYVTEKATDIILVLDDSNSMFPSSTDGRTINNAEITKTAISAFLDVALGENSDNRIAVVQYNSYAGAWNGSRFVKYNGTMSGYSTLTEANCFMSDRTKVDTAIKTALTQDSDNGATNTMGGFKMAQIVAETRSKSTERNLLILLFTDGEPTVRYEDNSSTVTSDLFTDLGYGDTDYSAARTSYIEYDRALASGQNLRKSVDSFSNAQNYIYSVALLGGEDYSEADYILAENLMGTAPKGFTFGNDKIENLLDYVYDTSRWFDAASFSNAYFAVKGKDATSVTNDMVDIFKQIAYTTVEDSYLSGTVVDTIPADFKLTDSSINDLEKNGWTITYNDDGTTTISKTNVLANEIGSSVTYEIEYQGSGYGATFTNTAATYAYTDILTGQPVTASFVKPVVQVIPWTVNDSVVTGIGVDTVIDIRANDPFKELTAAGYTIVDYQVELTDKNGESTKYHDSTEQVGCKFDASWDENSQTVSFYTLAAGEYHFYYVVKATVLSPDGKTETTVTSRATSVSVEVKTLQTTNDAGVAVSGSENTINVLWNDALTIDDVAMTNITGTVLYITDSDGNKIQDVTGFDAITPNEDGSISYTTQKNYGLGKICEFYYVVEQTGELNGEQITLSSKATKVTIFSVEDQYIVVDFGLPTKYERYVTDTDTYIADGVKLQNKLTVGALTGDGKYGTLTSDVSNREFSFAPTTMNFDGTCDYTYTVTMTKSAYTKEEVSGTGKVTVIPANNVYFEESFLTTDRNLWGYESDTTGAQREGTQTVDNALRHGYDAHYEPEAGKAAENYSNGNELSVTVSTENRDAPAYFTFTGTGFDIYSECNKGSGVLVAEVYKYDNSKTGNMGELSKAILMDTHLSIEVGSYYQIPSIICRDLTYGPYVVKLRAFYNEIFDHNYTKSASESAIRMVLGLDEKTELVCLDMSSVSLEGAKYSDTRKVEPAKKGQYNVYIDAIRIYNPLGTLSDTDGIAYTAYNEANELNPTFENINDKILDAKNATDWADSENTVNGALFIAGYTGGGDSNASQQEVFADDGAVYLGSAGLIKTQKDPDNEEDTKDYLVDKDGNWILYDGEKVYMKRLEITDENKAGIGFFYDKDGETHSLNRAQLSTLNIYCYENRYDAIGPENEVYLKTGSGLAFNVPANEHIQISAKVPFGTSAKLQAYKGGKWHTVAVVSSRTEMYYDLTNYVEDQKLIVRCLTSETDGVYDQITVLSLCNVKGTGAATKLLTVNGDTLVAAMKAFYPMPKEHTHSYTEVVTEPTCTEQGFTTHTCECSDSFVDTYVDAQGHAWDQGTETLAPTATEDGVMTYTCERCGETKTEPIAATGEPELPPDPIGGDDEPDENPDENPEEKPCDGGEGCPSAQFTDVSPKEWYHLSVDYVVTHNLMEGVGGGKFDPEGTMNRAMLVTVLWRYEGKPAGEKNTFSDVPANEWYTEAVAWAAKNGIVNGIGDGKFDPLGKITREQMATILYRYTENRGFGETTKRGDLRDFPDAKMISEYATDAVAWAVGEGLILGSEGKLLPQGDATRAQVATILMRYIETIVK